MLSALHSFHGYFYDLQKICRIEKTAALGGGTGRLSLGPALLTLHVHYLNEDAEPSSGPLRFFDLYVTSTYTPFWLGLILLKGYKKINITFDNDQFCVKSITDENYNIE